MISIARKPINAINALGGMKKQAESVACKTPFYHWLLSSGDSPSQLSVKLADPWSGQADPGRLMVHGVLHAFGESLPLDARFWDTSETLAHWRQHVHSFVWLRDLRAAGGDSARRLARQMADAWMSRYDRWDAGIWQPDLMGKRISMWLSFYDFFCASADESFQDRYFATLNRQARHLSRSFPAGLSGLPLLEAARGLVYAGLSFPGREAWIFQGFDTILKEIPRQVTQDGTHISGSPSNLLEMARLCLDLRYALHRAELPVPQALQDAIERMGPALRFFCYPDRKLGLHHGGQEGQISEIDSVLSQIRGSRRPLKGSSLAGFERVMVGRSFLMLDHSAPPPSPFDTAWHSAPLSFEFMYGRDRIFTHCGGYPQSSDWEQILRHTAAHNTATIDGRPVHDFRNDFSIGKRSAAPQCTRTETRDACLLDGSHEGYKSSRGITHRRRLFLTDGGHDLRGEDSFDATSAAADKCVTVRFHLHPRVQITASTGENELLLTLPSGSSWRFYNVGGTLDLEDSLYFGQGVKPRKTSQIVITAPVHAPLCQIKWALQRV